MSKHSLLFLLSFDELPQEFPSPFDVVPHSAAQQAADSLKARLPDLCPVQHRFNEPDGGKMFGVLVVRNTAGQTGYLAAYSGMLGGEWHTEGFVPPVFDSAARQMLLQDGEAKVAELTDKIKKIEADPDYRTALANAESYKIKAARQLEAAAQQHRARKDQRHQLRQSETIGQNQLDELANQSRNDKYELKSLKKQLQTDGEEIFSTLERFQLELNKIIKQRKNLSSTLQKQVFSGYALSNVNGSTRLMAEFFEDGMPSSGAGDCAATKLIQYANNNALLPLALAEFWWGVAPAAALRKHGRYYPSCRSRCRKILPFMLDPLAVTVPLHERPVDFGSAYPYTLYEDEDIVVINKPAGLLSVPGKVLIDSVEMRLKARYPEVAGVMLLHRLDQATSGVMIAAKHARAYKHLQHQFQDRTVNKQYIAVLDGVLEENHGRIALPLRIDIYDRPRQIVCHERGKSSLTKYKVLSCDKNTTRVAFYPHTGRTHQLRVHAAHPDGLNCPILGDELYGRPADRLHLHAAELSITQPTSGDRLTFSAEVSF